MLLGAFLVVNRHIPGLLVIALGGALNFAAIRANGGVMPADPDAIAAAGIAAQRDRVHELRAGRRRPARLPRRRLPHARAGCPIHNVFSVGDLVIVTGAFLLLHCACGSPLGRLPPRLRPAEA